MPVALFALVIFLIGIQSYAQASLGQNPLIYTSLLIGMTGIPQCPVFTG
jgi:steroid 5-alpha reductase family enzyme